MKVVERRMLRVVGKVTHIVLGCHMEMKQEYNN